MGGDHDVHCDIHSYRRVCACTHCVIWPKPLVSRQASVVDSVNPSHPAGNYFAEWLEAESCLVCTALEKGAGTPNGRQKNARYRLTRRDQIAQDGRGKGKPCLGGIKRLARFKMAG